MRDQPQNLRAPSCRPPRRIPVDRLGSHDADPATVSPQPDVAGFVLAGGQSTRMGRDKALLEFCGRPLIAHALSILEQAGLPASIAGAHADLAHYAAVVPDAASGLGPLSGICAALESTTAQYAVFLPVDQPLVPPALVAALVHHAQITGCAVTMPALCGVAQTFPAIVNSEALPALQAELAAGRRGCKAAFRAASGGAESTVAVELLVQAGQIADPHQLPPSWWFLNANTPAEMERILHRMRGIT